MKDVLKAIERRDSVTVTYRGTKIALLVPTPQRGEGFGLWKDRKDLRDVASYVRAIRKRRSTIPA